MSRVLRIPLTCSVDDDRAELSYDSGRITTIRSIWEISLEETESVIFELPDFDQDGAAYTISAKSSLEGGDWITWERTQGGAVSPSISEAGRLEIEVVATSSGSQAAAGTTATTVLRRPGRPDKAAS